MTGHPRLDWIGTGFLVAPDVIMTNRHVAVEFSERKRGEGWRFISGILPRVDFREEFQGTTMEEYPCVEVVGIHSQLDLALLRIEMQTPVATALPSPLTIQSDSLRSKGAQGVCCRVSCLGWTTQ